jgi:hypothetical protein
MVTKFTDLFLRNLKKATSGQENYIDKVPPLASVNGFLGLKVGKHKMTWYTCSTLRENGRCMEHASTAGIRRIIW